MKDGVGQRFADRATLRSRGDSRSSNGAPSPPKLIPKLLCCGSKEPRYFESVDSELLSNDTTPRSRARRRSRRGTKRPVANRFIERSVCRTSGRKTLTEARGTREVDFDRTRKRCDPSHLSCSFSLAFVSTISDHFPTDSREWNRKRDSSLKGRIVLDRKLDKIWNFFLAIADLYAFVRNFEMWRMHVNCKCIWNVL